MWHAWPSPRIIREIMKTVSIPVMAKARIGHFAEAQVLQALEVDFIDESEVLTPADEENHIWKHDFKVPFVCGARNLGEALRRIAEGAAMIRTKGEAGSGNIVEAVRHMRTIVCGDAPADHAARRRAIARGQGTGGSAGSGARGCAAGKLPVPNFSAGGIATPADAALVRHLGAEAVFVGSGIFKSSDPEKRARAIVKAATHYQDPKAVLEASEEARRGNEGAGRAPDSIQRICCRRAAGRTSRVACCLCSGTRSMLRSAFSPCKEITRRTRACSTGWVCLIGSSARQRRLPGWTR